MKKTINIILVLILTIFLTSCFGSNNDDQINQAKKNLGVIEPDSSDTGGNIGLDNTLSGTLSDSGSEILPQIQEFKKIEVTTLTDDQFIELDDLLNEDLTDGKVEIKGSTLVDVDKITITFENSNSSFPKDVYPLKQFSSGDKTFLYRAFSKYQTFDYGRNIYTIEAYSGDKVSKLQLVINLTKEEEKDALQNVEQISENISFDTLPVLPTFGNPVDLGNGKITYSDLKGLEISKYSFTDLTCENLTTVLGEKLNSWFYWNTCRPIDTDKGFSFYVIRLDGDKYVYEKQYYLSNQGIYGVQELDTGEGVNKDNLKEKNIELKDKNEEFTITKVSDDLFNKIVK